MPTANFDDYIQNVKRDKEFADLLEIYEDHFRKELENKSDDDDGQAGVTAPIKPRPTQPNDSIALKQ